MLSVKVTRQAADTIFKVFDMTQLRIKPSLPYFVGERSNQNWLYWYVLWFASTAADDRCASQWSCFSNIAVDDAVYSASDMNIERRWKNGAACWVTVSFSRYDL